MCAHDAVDALKGSIRDHPNGPGRLALVLFKLAEQS
jgi:hypothetical protein